MNPLAADDLPSICSVASYNVSLHLLGIWELENGRIIELLAKMKLLMAEFSDAPVALPQPFL